MRNRTFVIAAWLGLFCAVACAQEDAKRPLIVPLPDGGFVAFKSESKPADGKVASLSLEGTQKVLTAQASLDENQIIHRVLSDSTGRVVFAYDLSITTDHARRRFAVVVRPLDAQFRNALWSKRETQAVKSPGVATFPRSAEPQFLDDGDAISLDLLVNQQEGVKIVDIVRVSFDRSLLFANPMNLARDFTLDSVELNIKDYKLLINGKQVAAGKPSVSCAGAIVWFYLQDHGRFIFSLTPREGYAFQKVGVIDENKIEFTLNGDRYEWISSAPVLRDGGTWNLWVLRDPKYTPFVGAESPAAKKDPFEKLDAAAAKAQDQAARARAQKQGTFNGGNESGSRVPVRLRMMVGGADRIENVWPR
jgi:hypothetical protein